MKEESKWKENESARLKDVVGMNLRSLPETTSDDYEFRYVDIGSVDSSGEINFDESITFSQAPSRARRIVRENDVIISTVRTYLRAIAAIRFDPADVIVSTGFAVCSPRPNVVPQYLSYALRCDDVMDWICAESTGISYPAINSSKLSAVSLPYPPLPAQRAIAAYLDEKTAAIEAKVKVLGEMLEKYRKLKTAIINRAVTCGLNPNVKLKDSGVDWIGQVPDGWKIERLKTIGERSGCLFTDGDWINYEDISEEGVRYFTTGNVGVGVFKEQGQGYVTEETFKRLNCLAVYGGDLIISRLNLPIGRACILPKEYEKCIVAVDCVVFRPGKEYDKSYLVYAMSTTRYLDKALLLARGTTMMRITRTQLGNMEVPVPPLSEQREIAAYLDEKCAKIDEAAAIVEKQIDAYKRLKRSLINEVVTGKRKVA